VGRSAQPTSWFFCQNCLKKSAKKQDWLQSRHRIYTSFSNFFILIVRRLLWFAHTNRPIIISP
jgi:hypothetical protein